MFPRTGATETDGETADDQPARPAAHRLAAGGFAPDVAVVTTAGPVPVMELAPGQQVYALAPTTGICTLKPLAAVSEVAAPARLVNLETQRASLTLAPDQPLPCRTPAEDTPRWRPVGDLDRSYLKFVNEWRPRQTAPVETIDITDHLAPDAFAACAATDAHGHTFRAALPADCTPCRRNSHTGYYFDGATFSEHQAAIEAAADRVTIQAAPGHRRRPYRFDATDFLTLVGWFVTEGSVHWPAARETAQVNIAQDTPRHRATIRALFDRLGLSVSIGPKRFELGSALYGRLFADLCGTDSRSKRLPPFVWRASPHQRRVLLTTLVRGDGNERQTYYTTSDALAAAVCRLCVGLGLTPRFTRRDDVWQLYIRRVNDGFSGSHVSHRPATTDRLVRLTLTDYPAVMAGRDGRFQWVGVSEVA